MKTNFEKFSEEDEPRLNLLFGEKKYEYEEDDEEDDVDELIFDESDRQCEEFFKQNPIDLDNLREAVENYLRKHPGAADINAQFRSREDSSSTT
jgi:hypothetical protein